MSTQAADAGVVVLDVHPDLRPLLVPRHRRTASRWPVDPTSTVGHVVQAAGIPLTEVGGLLLDGSPVAVSRRTDTAGVLRVLPVRRPQPTPTDPARFLLDVHLGSLARRLRLLGVDTSYGTDASDDDLVQQTLRERRVLLTKDRGLLRRRLLSSAAADGAPVARGALVGGTGVEQEVVDVLDRFAPRLAPWTRCPACNGLLDPVGRADVEAQLPPGTRRSYDTFARCRDCRHVYWRGAHATRLDAAVRRATSPPARRR